MSNLLIMSMRINYKRQFYEILITIIGIYNRTFYTFIPQQTILIFLMIPTI